MKILLVISTLECGGAESHLCDLAKGLLKKGHEITVASSGGRLAEYLESFGIEHVYLPLDRKTPISIFLSYRSLSRLMKNGNFDIAHAHSRLAATVLHFAAKRRGVAFTTTVHAEFSAEWIYRRLSRWGSVCIAVSEDLRQYLCENYSASPENIRFIPNGIDTDAFLPVRMPLSMPRRVVFVSRLDRDCSDLAFMLCEISERVRAVYKDTEFFICGGGEMLTELALMSADKPWFHLLGRVERVEEILKNAHVFLGVSRAAMEAMACGIPTVLGGNEGYFGMLESRDDLDRAALGNFCCRGMERASVDKLFVDICKCLSLDDESFYKLSALLSEYINIHNSSNLMVEQTECVYREISERHRAINRKAEVGGVVLCGYYGFGNMGDNALLRSSVDIAKRRFSQKRISALTRRGKKDSDKFGIPCVSRTSPWAVCRELKSASVLVFGGGTLLQDTTSLRSLIYYAAIIEYAAVCGVRIELWGNGIGMERGIVGRNIIKHALSKCHRVGLRDLSSLSYCLSLAKGFRDIQIYYEPDLAMRLIGAPRSRIEYLLEHFGLMREGVVSKFAVVAVKGTSGRGYIEIFSRHLTALVKNSVKLLFVPMFEKEDITETRRLCELHGGTVAENISENDMIGLISHSCTVVGMRLHALVFAASVGIPFVGFGSDPKLESFCREHAGDARDARDAGDARDARDARDASYFSFKKEK